MAFPARRTALTAHRIAGTLLAAGLLAAIGGAGLFVVHYRIHRVPSPSMQPTLQPGDRILSDQLATGAAGSIRRGDIVIVAPGGGVSGAGPTDQVKRVIALGGDTLTCCDSDRRLQLDGRSLDEPYLTPSAAEVEPFRVRVPPGTAFLLGDHRDLSVDSRAGLANGQAGVPLATVRGRVVGVATPFDRARIVGRDSGTMVLTVRLIAAGLVLTALAAAVPAVTAARSRLLLRR